MQKKVLTGSLLWLLAAIGVTASGILAGRKPPTLQLVVAIETFLLVILYVRSSTFAEYVRSAPSWRLTLFHVWRIVPGIGFLVLYRHQLLPREFAVPAGLGDIVIALLAPLFVLVALRSSALATKAVLAFQLLGLVDLLAVVSSAARISLADPAAMRVLSLPPLVMVPIFGVPLTIFLHIVAIDQCRRMLNSATRSASSSSR